ncbi:hypothetical protein EJ08DRAFT_400325 [Tothia fuscella]|uniref:Uncharacterized protein n=1 Tax=Tothia fuscella TaxID=1048955 RepID=A0A9P4TVB8_9PEZI|nr:hypothetical protein EJ08DRAFT_400325 [Tothia fuscella]
MASRCSFGAKEAIQHVAAGMLLCLFEVHQSSCTSSEWMWYICGVKRVLTSGSLTRNGLTPTPGYSQNTQILKFKKKKSQTLFTTHYTCTSLTSTTFLTQQITILKSK